MELLLEKLGIDWRLFIAQVINFLVLFFVLKRFLYKPVLGMLERRRETIEKSLEDAKKIEEAAGIAALQKEEILREARREAGNIIEEAGKRAEATREEKLLLTKQEVEKIIVQGKVQLGAEREAVMRGIKAEAAELVASAVEKILADVSNEKIDKALAAKALAGIARDKSSKL